MTAELGKRARQNHCPGLQAVGARIDRGTGIQEDVFDQDSEDLARLEQQARHAVGDQKHDQISAPGSSADQSGPEREAEDPLGGRSAEEDLAQPLEQATAVEDRREEKPPPKIAPVFFLGRSRLEAERANLLEGGFTVGQKRAPAVMGPNGVTNVGVLIHTHRRQQQESGQGLPDPAVEQDGPAELAVGSHMAVGKAEGAQRCQDQPPADDEQGSGTQPAGLSAQGAADTHKSQGQADQSGIQVVEVADVPKYLASVR